MRPDEQRRVPSVGDDDSFGQGAPLSIGLNHASGDICIHLDLICRSMWWGANTGGSTSDFGGSSDEPLPASTRRDSPTRADVGAPLAPESLGGMPGGVAPRSLRPTGVKPLRRAAGPPTDLRDFASQALGGLRAFFGALVRHCSEWWPWAGFRQSKGLGGSWVEEPTDGADIP